MNRQSFRIAASTVACAAAVALSIPPTCRADTAPDPFFGTWSDGMSIIAQQGRPASQARLDDVAASGAGMVRQYIWWDRIETSPGVFDWKVLDQLVADATARGVTVLPTLLYTPSFYSSKPAGSHSSAQFPPSDPQALARFATAIVQRYGTHGEYWGCSKLPVAGWHCNDPYKPILMWEVWNEPDYPSWWKGAPNPAEYLQLLKATSTAIKAADPKAKVVLSALTNNGGGSSDGYLEQLYQLGAAQYFDVLSHNPYGWDVGSMMAFIHGLRSVAARHGDAAKPLLLTEYGWATVPGSTYYISASAKEQAALLYAATQQLFARRQELNLIGVVQFQWQDVQMNSTAWPFYAGVRYANGTAKPALSAYSAAVRGDAAPPGYTLAEACPPNRRPPDGQLLRINVQTTGTGVGSVESDPSGINCPSDCSRELQPGIPITLTASPPAGSAVVAWKGVDCIGLQCTFTPAGDTDIEVVFSDSPPAGVYQEASGDIVRTGSWLLRADQRDRGGAAAVAPNAPAAAELSFYGSGVRWVARRGPAAGKQRVLIDGVAVGVVDLYRAAKNFGVVVFDSGPLAPGEHKIRIEHTGQKNAAASGDNLWLDAFVVR